MRRVVVVGGGPAGMAAAAEAAAAGVEVVLVDDGPKLGGQYHRQDARAGGDRFAPVEGVEHLADSAVWAIERTDTGHCVHVRTGPADAPGRRGRTIETRALVLATGAYDRVLPFPGWDLPGVYTAGGAQALAKSQAMAIGDRVVVAGTGPFLLPVAATLTEAGARVVAVLEAGEPIGGWLSTAPRALSGWRKSKELAACAAVLARHGVPVCRRSAVVAAHGTDRVEAVIVSRLDADWNPLERGQRRFEVDAVAVGFGFTPQLELAVAARCSIEGGFVEVDAAQGTSTDGVFAAGELTGIGGAESARAEGLVAGRAAAAFVGARVSPPVRAMRRARSGRRFAEALSAAHPVRPGWRQWLDDDTLVCRCEEVTYADLTRSVAMYGADGVRTLKLTTRAGLGPCQGRVCGRQVAELAGLDDPSAFARRPIASPLRLGELAEPVALDRAPEPEAPAASDEAFGADTELG